MTDLATADTSPPRRGSAATVVGWAITIGLVVAALIVGVRRWNDLQAAGAMLAVWHLGLSSLGNVVGNGLLADAWRRLLATSTAVPNRSTIARLWSTAQLSRYTISAATFGARPLLARQYGLPVGVSATTTLLEAVWMVSINGAVVILTAPVWVGKVPGSTALVVAAIVVVAVLLGLSLVPNAWATALRLLTLPLPTALRERVRGALSPLSELDRRTAAGLSLQYLVNYAVRLGAFLVIAIPVAGSGSTRFISVALAAFAVGRLAGSLAVVVPAGIGPKEGLTAALLAIEIGLAPAVVVVAAARLTEVVGELVFFAGARSLGDNPGAEPVP